MTYSVSPCYAMGLQIPDSWEVHNGSGRLCTCGSKVDAQFLANLMNSVTREQVNAARRALYAEAAE